MATLIVFHVVDDVDHWLHSTRRQDLFGPLGATVRTFVDPNGSNRTGLIIETPDIDAFNAVMGSPDVIDAMQEDGIQPETLVVLAEA